MSEGKIIGILSFIFIVGNIILFTSALNGDWGNFEITWFMVIGAVIEDIILLLWLLKKVYIVAEKKHKNNKAKRLTNKRETLVKEMGRIISYKQEILQAFDKYFNKIEKQFSLISLISSCIGNNDQSLERLFVDINEEAFTNTKKEIFEKLSEDERKKLPDYVSEVAKYKKSLEQEISELKIDLGSITASDDKQLSKVIKKHCPELCRKIKRKKIMLITSIVMPTIIALSVVLSPTFALIHAKEHYQSVLETILLDDNISSCSINNIEYDKKHDNAYDVTDIRLWYDDYFSKKTEKEIRTLLRQLHRKLNVNFTFNLAQHILSFELDENNYNIILIDKDSIECSFNGRDFDMNN